MRLTDREREPVTPNSKLMVRIFTPCSLLLMCTLIHAQGPSAASGRQLFNVVDYGAHRDGSATATEAFRRAIEAAKAAGGGTIYVPPGKYVTGPIELFSNMTLDIDSGATVAFPVSAIPFEKTRYLGVETLAPMALVGGRDVENVTVTGRGILTTGLYEDWGRAYGPPPVIPKKSDNANGPNWDHLLRSLEEGKAISQKETLAAAPELRPSFVYFINAKNVLVENVRIVGAPMFAVHLLYSENATVRNVMIQANPGPHVNGIVVDSSRFVHVSDDYIDVGDDGIVIKAGKDADGLRVNRPSENVTITNCTVHHAHGAVVIGSETSGSIRNVTASNITAVDTENGIRLKSRRGRGGVVEDVRFDNWTMENVGTGIVVTTYYVMGGETNTTEEAASRRTPVFRNIGISNITLTHARKMAIDIEGLPEMLIATLRLTDVLASGATGLLATYTDQLELRHVQVDSERGPAFTIANAANLLLDDVTSRKPVAGSPLIRMTNSQGAILEQSRAFPGTGTFLSTGKGELSTVRMLGNLLEDAKVAKEEN
jgi:polygalacturonase